MIPYRRCSRTGAVYPLTVLLWISARLPRWLLSVSPENQRPLTRPRTPPRGVAKRGLGLVAVTRGRADPDPRPEPGISVDAYGQLTFHVACHGRDSESPFSRSAVGLRDAGLVSETGRCLKRASLVSHMRQEGPAVLVLTVFPQHRWPTRRPISQPGAWGHAGCSGSRKAVCCATGG